MPNKHEGILFTARWHVLVRISRHMFQDCVANAAAGTVRVARCIKNTLTNLSENCFSDCTACLAFSTAAMS